MYNAKHIYLVFNPLLNKNDVFPSQAHEFYYNLKEKWMNGDHSNAFMYWGKISVTEHSQQDIEQLNQIIRENAEYGEETYLYISDFHHFWVGKVESVHKEIVNTQHTLAFYDNKKVDLWFKVTDFDLLASNFEETNYFLQNLYCDNEYTTQKIDQVDPYIFNVKFPMVVQSRLMDTYFRNSQNQKITRVLNSNALIETPKLIGKVKEQVKTFVLRPDTFHFLSHKVKHDVLTAESYLVKEMNNQQDKFKEVLKNYLNVFQDVIGDTFGELLKAEYGHCLYVSSLQNTISDSQGDGFVLLRDFKGKIDSTLLFNLFHNSKNLGNISFERIKNQFPVHFEFFQNQVVPFMVNFELASKIEVLQSSVEFNVNTQEVLDIRNQILGIGHVGFLNQLAHLFGKENLLQKLNEAA